MVTVGGSIGVGVFGNTSSYANSSGGSVGAPEVFVALQDQTVFQLSKAAKSVVVMHNENTIYPITDDIPQGDYTHVADETAVTFNFNTDEGDIIQIIPFY